MKLKLSALLTLTALCCFSSQAFAITCTSTTSWGSLGAPGNQNFGRSFSSSGNYADCYTFSVSGAADAFGGLTEVDPWLNKLDIDVTGASLFSGGLSGGHTVGSLFGNDSSPSGFNFSNLSLGTYSFVVFTNVSYDFGLLSSAVSYNGTISTTRRTTTPVPVPEPAGLAVFGAGLILLAVATRRRSLRGTR